MIYTSYFAKLREVRDTGLVPVSIAQRKPRGVEVLSYKKLAPPWALVKEYKQSGDTLLYTRVYFDTILNKLNQYQVISELVLCASSSNIVLICYEKPEDFCHRHLVAQWLNRILPKGEEVTELEI